MFRRAILQQVLLAAFGGVLYFVGFVGFDVFPLSWICFVPALFAIRGASLGRTLLLGAVFGTVTNMGGYYWVVHLIREFGGLSTPLAALGYVLLCAYQGFLLALVLLVVRIAERDLEIAPVWSLPVAFVALEVAYPLLFPSYIGNSQYRFTAITQIVELAGMPALTALISLVNGAVYELLEARRAGRSVSRRRVTVPATVFALSVVYGLVRIPMVERSLEGARRIDVALVQTNLGAGEKHARRSEFIERHRTMTRAALIAHPEIDLVVWPESAYNDRLPREIRNVSRAVTQDIDRPVIFGAITGVRGESMYNTAVITSSTGDVVGLYDKVELLAFGETLPLIDTIPALRSFLPKHAAFFTRGTNLANLEVEGMKLLPMICYEDILPALVRRIWRTSGPAHALVNITNDSWYGDTHEPLIHLVLASFRSIETRRPLIRSTNTGISAFVDPVGRIVARTGQWTQETLVDRVPLVESGDSTVYMVIGDVFAYAAVLLTATGIIWASRARRRRR